MSYYIDLGNRSKEIEDYLIKQGYKPYDDKKPYILRDNDIVGVYYDKFYDDLYKPHYNCYPTITWEQFMDKSRIKIDCLSNSIANAFVDGLRKIYRVSGGLTRYILIENETITFIDEDTFKSLDCQEQTMYDFKIKDIMIGKYKVAFKEDSIQVGCEVISKETVREIYERLYESK